MNFIGLQHKSNRQFVLWTVGKMIFTAGSGYEPLVKKGMIIANGSSHERTGGDEYHRRFLANRR